jgi:zinc-finger of the FCS-type, C2-C2
MLRRRSSPLPSPSANRQQRNKPKTPSPFLFPRHLLVRLSPKGGFSSPLESTMSPTFVLETSNSSSINSPFFPFSDKLSSTRKPKPAYDTNPKLMGLGLVDALDSDKFDKMVLIGSKLRNQALCMNPMPISRSGSIEFGIKNRESKLALLSPKLRSPVAMERQSSRVMNVDEIEMSEDYTCVIAHGPNPRKTHIFDNCVVDKCGGAFWEMPRDEGRSNGGDFLSFCHLCKRSLGEGRDIFMYRLVLKSQLSILKKKLIY